LGDPRITADVLVLEEGVLAPWATWRRGLEALRVEQQRRALRLKVQDLRWEYESCTLKLRFRLTRGAFATAVLREIVATSGVASLSGDD
jgi:tRNA pseudouridine13 synthase